MTTRECHDGGAVDQPGLSRGLIYAETLSLSWLVFSGGTAYSRSFHLLDASRVEATSWNVRIYGQQLLQNLIGVAATPPSQAAFDAGARPSASLQARVTWQGGAVPQQLIVDVSGSALLSLPKCRKVSVDLLVTGASAKLTLGSPSLWEQSTIPAGLITGGLLSARVNASAYAVETPVERSRLRVTTVLDLPAATNGSIIVPAGAQRVTVYDGPQAAGAANPGNLYRWLAVDDPAAVTTLPLGNVVPNDASVVPGLATALQAIGDPANASRVTAVWELE